MRSLTENLPVEVTRAPLDTYSDASLTGRLAYYEREALFERDALARDALKVEARRTHDEIERRKELRAAEASKVFRGVVAA